MPSDTPWLAGLGSHASSSQQTPQMRRLHGAFHWQYSVCRQSSCSLEVDTSHSHRDGYYPKADVRKPSMSSNVCIARQTIKRTSPLGRSSTSWRSSTRWDAQFVMRPFEIFRTAPNRRRSLIAAIMMWGRSIPWYLRAHQLRRPHIRLSRTPRFQTVVVERLLDDLHHHRQHLDSIVHRSLGKTDLSADRSNRRDGFSRLPLRLDCNLSQHDEHSRSECGLSSSSGSSSCGWCFFVDATQYVYVSEIWPNHLRSQGTAWGLAFFYLASEITLVAAPVALNSIGWRFYLVLIVPSVCYIAAIWFLFPVSIAMLMRFLIASTDFVTGDQRTDLGRDWIFVWRRAYCEPLVRYQ